MGRTSCFFDELGRTEVPVYDLKSMLAQQRAPGPCIIIDKTTTMVVEPGCTAQVTGSGDVRIDVPRKSKGDAAAAVGAAQRPEDIDCDPITLAIFSHRQVLGWVCLALPALLDETRRH